MARLTRCFLLLLFSTLAINTVTPFAHANKISNLLSHEWFPAGPDCLGDVLGAISTKNILPEERIKLEGAAYYNDQIFKKFGDIPTETWNTQVQKTMDYYGQYDLQFDTPKFKNWLKENPAEIDPKSTIGKYTNERFNVYKKSNPQYKIQKSINEVHDGMLAIGKECGENKICQENRIAALVKAKFKNTCLGQQPAALKNLVLNLVYANIGYAMTVIKKPENGYPYDLLVNNLLWAYPMASLGCHNNLARGEPGKKINFQQKVYYSEKVKGWANNYISYMITSPFYNTSYVAFHTARQMIRGDKKWEEVDIWQLAKQVGALTRYDATWPVPRMVLFTDPLYLKYMPKYGQILDRNISNQVTANAAYFISDGISRTGLSYINTEMLNSYLKSADKKWDTGFMASEEPPSPTPAPAK